MELPYQVTIVLGTYLSVHAMYCLCSELNFANNHPLSTSKMMKMKCLFIMNRNRYSKTVFINMITASKIYLFNSIDIKGSLQTQTLIHIRH